MKKIISESIRYWEPRRLVFNIVLALVVAGSFVGHLPSSAKGIGWQPLIGLFLAAVIANVLYCMAYVADMFIADVFFQAAKYQRLWRRSRWILLVTGAASGALAFLLHQ
jgi:hypothetical protein